MQAPNHLINIAKDTLISLNEFAAVPGVYGSVGKESACHAGDPGSIPGLGRSSGDGNRNPLLYCCLENRVPKEAGRIPSMGSQESDTTYWLNHHHHHHQEFWELWARNCRQRSDINKIYLGYLNDQIYIFLYKLQCQNIATSSWGITSGIARNQTHGAVRYKP